MPYRDVVMRVRLQINFIMVNVFLAIVMDAYVVAKEDADGTDSLIVELINAYTYKYKLWYGRLPFIFTCGFVRINHQVRSIIRCAQFACARYDEAVLMRPFR